MFSSTATLSRLARHCMLTCILLAATCAQATEPASAPPSRPAPPEPGGVALLGLGVLLFSSAQRRIRRY